MQTRLPVWQITLNPTLIIPNTVSPKPHPINSLILYWDINANTVIQKELKKKKMERNFYTRVNIIRTILTRAF